LPILSEQERVGTLVGGRYRIEQILGRGSTGVVYDAVHSWTGRRVAVKLLRPEYARDVAVTRRFLQEARAASNLAHPHLVQVLDMGSEPDTGVYLVLERLEGESLGSLLEREGRLSAARTLELLLPVCEGLRAAHRAGVVHRDIKPDNVFLHVDAHGAVVPKLLDFGMAKVADAAWGTATQTGTLIGTPFYMSPEQAEGSSDQGPQADVWSVGVVLYRCLTGELPFFAETPASLLMKIVHEPPLPVLARWDDGPCAVAAVVDAALARDRAVRHPDIETMIERLRAAAIADGVAPPSAEIESVEIGGGLPVTPEPFDPGPRLDERPPPRTWRRWGALAIAVATLAAAAGVGVWSMEGPAAATVEATARVQDTSETPPVAEPPVVVPPVAMPPTPMPPVALPSVAPGEPANPTATRVAATTVSPTVASVLETGPARELPVAAAPSSRSIPTRTPAARRTPAPSGDDEARTFDTPARRTAGRLPSVATEW
jgi:serine/threonine-protein kinase